MERVGHEILDSPLCSTWTACYSPPPEVGIPGGTGTARIAYLQAWVFAQWRRYYPQSVFPDSLSTALVWLIIVFASFRFARAPSTAPTPSGSIFAKAAPVIRRRS